MNLFLQLCLLYISKSQAQPPYPSKPLQTPKSPPFQNLPDNRNPDPSEHSIPELNTIISTFRPCLIHLLNFEYIDFVTPFSLPVVLERYGSVKEYLQPSPTSHQAKLMRRQMDGFKWRCVFHGFLHQKLHPFSALQGKPIIDFLPFPPYFSFYWTGSLGKPNALPGTETIFQATSREWDYYFLFTRKAAPEEWKVWLRLVEMAGSGGGVSNNGIILHNPKSGLHKYFLGCPHCLKEQIELREVPSLSLLQETFLLLRSIRVNEKPVVVADIERTGPTGETLWTKPPTFASVNEMERLDLLMFQLVFQNQSYTFDFSANGNGDFLCPYSVLVDVNLRNAPRFKVIESTSYTFLTCDGVRVDHHPSFYAFISAYHPSTWVLVAVAALVFAGTLQLIFGAAGVSQNALFLPMMLLIEQGVEVKEAAGRMTSTSIALGSWLLMCVILTNAYKGQNITDLTSPLKPELFEYFGELLTNNFTLIVPVAYRYFPKYRNYSERSNGIFHFDLWQWRQQLEYPNVWWKEGNVGELLESINQIENHTFTLKKAHNMTLLESIMNCNRSALVAYSDEVDVFEFQLRHYYYHRWGGSGDTTTTHKISKGKEKILQSGRGWIFRYSYDPRLELRLQTIQHSGILNVWRNYLGFLKSIRISQSHLKGNEEVVEEEIVTKLSVYGNLIVVFYVYAVLVIASCGFALMELIAWKCLRNKRHNLDLPRRILVNSN